MEKAIILFIISFFVLLGIVKFIELVLTAFDVKNSENVYLICVPRDSEKIELTVRSFCLDIEKVGSDKKTALIIDDYLSKEGKEICIKTAEQFNNAIICSLSEAKKICAV